MTIDKDGNIDWTLYGEYSPEYHESHDQLPSWIPIVIVIGLLAICYIIT